MAIYTCKMCGGELEIMEGNVCRCLYCERMQTIPTGNDEKKINLFNRANALRARNEFDAAATVFESIVSEFPDEAEAYWGLCLCRYGIEYVEDPATHVRKPTCHRTEYESILNDSDYLQATRLASAMSRHLYEDEAREIDRLQKEILAIAANEQAYDIFICYKETDELGNRTQDSVIAMDIYKELTKEGYKVFFARITLEGKLGEAYEPIIFSALHSAKIMLVVGTKPEYFNAVWVKNEWSRFQKMMKTDSTKRIFPCYANMNAYEIPREINIVQAQDLSKIGAVQDLVWNIGKVIPLKKEQLYHQQNAGATVNAKLDNNIARGNLKITAEKWDEAKELFEKVIEEDVTDTRAHLGILLAEFKVKQVGELAQYAGKLKDNESYINICQLGDGAVKSELEGYVRAYEEEKHRAEEERRRIEEEQRREEDERRRRWTEDMNRYFEYDGTTIKKYIGDSTDPVIPDGVTRLSREAFFNRYRMTSVYIPDSVKVIEESVFENCKGLTEITIPNGVTTIGTKAFGRCRNLTSVTIPSSVIFLAEGAFRCCSGLTSVTIPGRISHLGNEIFAECTSLKKLYTAQTNVSFYEELVKNGSLGSGLPAIQVIANSELDIASQTVCKDEINRSAETESCNEAVLKMTIKDLVLPIHSLIQFEMTGYEDTTTVKEFVDAVTKDETGIRESLGERAYNDMKERLLSLGFDLDAAIKSAPAAASKQPVSGSERDRETQAASSKKVINMKIEELGLSVRSYRKFLIAHYKGSDTVQDLLDNEVKESRWNRLDGNALDEAKKKLRELGFDLDAAIASVKEAMAPPIVEWDCPLCGATNTGGECECCGYRKK